MTITVSVFFIAIEQLKTQQAITLHTVNFHYTQEWGQALKSLTVKQTKPLFSNAMKSCQHYALCIRGLSTCA